VRALRLTRRVSVGEAAKGVSLHRRQSDDIQTLMAGEGRVLEMISTGAPLSLVLDNIGTALDLEVGDVVSVILLTDDEEHFTHSIAQSAALFGLTVVSRTAILSVSGELLGMIEVYGCLSRGPTSSESKLIDRATQLAALAIQSHTEVQDSENLPFHWNGTTGKSTREGPPSKN
jgi:hypothetical protein